MITDQKMFGEGYQVLLPDMFHGFFHEHLHIDAQVSHLFIIQLNSNFNYCKKLSLYKISKRILSLKDMNVLLRKRIQVKLKYCYCYFVHVFKKCLHYQ
jgi:hypothetical protein